MNVSTDFLKSKYEDLYPQSFEDKGEAVRVKSYELLSRDEQKSAFKVINESYRAFLQDKIKGILKTTDPKMYWETVLLRPMAAAPTSPFGETRMYINSEEEFSRSFHGGMDLAGTQNAEVFSAAKGKIVFSGRLGIYGNAIIIDHGFGMSTLYGHLSTSLVSVGDMVEAAAKIGRTGMTGLAGGDHLHFEVRIYGEPVTPIEWWDSKWVRDHIYGKIEGVKKLLVADAKTAWDGEVK